jgi:predicted dehydrogenase
MNKIRWGMIGCGDVTEIKNGPGLYKSRDSELAGIFNRTVAKAEDWVKRHGHGKVFASIEELFASPEIDIVYIAVTPDAHKELALSCAKAGKHCYLEKPITPSYSDGEEIQRAFTEADKKIFVAHYRRGHPKTIMLQDLIKIISPVHSVRVFRTDTQKTISNWRGNHAVSGGGIFFETDVHLIDLLDYLFGPLQSWKLDASGRNGMEDSAGLLARGKDGIFLNGLWQYQAYKAEDICEVFGEKGTLSFQGLNPGGTAVLETVQGREEIVFPDEPHVGMPMEQMIVDELLGRGKCPSTLETAMTAFKICCEMWDVYTAGLPAGL